MVSIPEIQIPLSVQAHWVHRGIFQCRAVIAHVASARRIRAVRHTFGRLGLKLPLSSHPNTFSPFSLSKSEPFEYEMDWSDARARAPRGTRSALEKISGSSANASTHSTSIPLLGYGTASWPFGESEEIMKASILTAIKLGYRHFDAASVYQSEQCLGEAISRALELGLIESRGELFVTSKLWCSDVHPHRVLPALQDTLQKLGLEYLDLYLIHHPVSMKPAGSYVLPFNKSDLLPMDFKSVWEAMEGCHKLGLTKNIGVSNFSVKKLQQLLLTAKIPPAVNQVEMSPVWQQKKLRMFCEEKGIHVTAYSPLGAKGTFWGTDQVMECEILKEIAKAKGKTLAQFASDPKKLKAGTARNCGCAERALPQARRPCVDFLLGGKSGN